MFPLHQHCIFIVSTSDLFCVTYIWLLSQYYLYSNIPAGSVFFAVKDATKSTIQEYGSIILGSSVPKWLATTLSVAVALPPYWILRNPSEVVKTRQQANMDGYANVTTLEAYRNILSNERHGITDDGKTGGNRLTEFYAGYQENILYALPADVVKFTCYEALSRGRKNISPLSGAINGAVSTALAQFVTTPLDVVRNRVMTTKTSAAPDSNETIDSSSYFDSLKTLSNEEGLSGLFAGASPRVAKAVLSGAIQFATYEGTKQSIAKFFQERNAKP